LDKIFVLKKLYFLSNMENKFSSITSKYDHEVEVRQLFIPLDDTDMQIHQNISRAASYKMSLHANARYVLCERGETDVDRVPSTLIISHEENFDAVVALEVFKIAKSTDELSAGLVGRLSSLFGSDQCFSVCSFHPNLLLLVTRIWWGGPRSGVYLWYFEETCGLSFGNLGSQLQYQTMEVIRPLRDAVEVLTFSACGTQVIVKTYSDFLPSVHSITESAPYKWALTIDETNTTNTDSPEKKPIGTDKQAGMVATSSTASLIQGQLVVNAKGSINTTLQAKYNSQCADRSVEIVERSAGVERRQHIVSLPRWAHVEDTEISVRAPTTKDQRITIVLNKAAKPWYTLPYRQPQQHHLPALLRKDVRALGKAKKRVAKRSLAGGICDVEWREDDTDESERPSKMLKTITSRSSITTNVSNGELSGGKSELS
jgi:hypothetical protein